MLRAPLLKTVELHESYLTQCEAEDLVVFVRQRHILSSIVSFSWFNDYKLQVEPWMASIELFQLLLDVLQFTFPHIQHPSGKYRFFVFQWNLDGILPYHMQVFEDFVFYETTFCCTEELRRFYSD